MYCSLYLFPLLCVCVCYLDSAGIKTIAIDSHLVGAELKSRCVCVRLPVTLWVLTQRRQRFMNWWLCVCPALYQSVDVMLWVASVFSKLISRLSINSAPSTYCNDFLKYSMQLNA